MTLLTSRCWRLKMKLFYWRGFWFFLRCQWLNGEGLTVMAPCPSGSVVESIRNSCALTWKHFLQLLPFPTKKLLYFITLKKCHWSWVEMCRRNGLDPEIRRCNAEHVSFRTLAFVVHTFRRGFQSKTRSDRIPPNFLFVHNFYLFLKLKLA